jgi:hypothetical protein
VFEKLLRGQIAALRVRSIKSCCGDDGDVVVTWR